MAAVLSSDFEPEVGTIGPAVVVTVGNEKLAEVLEEYRYCMR